MKLHLVAVAAALAASSSVMAQKLERVTASWLPIMQTTAYYVALEEKLFEKAGIKINSVRFENPNQIIDSLISGQADFGPPGAAAGISILAEARYPGTFKVFGLQGGGIKVNLINDGLIVKNESTVKSFEDLKGKSLGHLPGIQWRTIARYIVRQNGLDPDKDIRLQELAVGLQVPSVLSGAVDATLSIEPVGSIAVASKDAKRAMINPVAMFISDPFFGGVSILTTKFIKERPTVARKLVETLDEATRLTMSNFDKYRPILPKYTAVKPDQVGVIAKPYLRGWKEITDTDLNAYQMLVDVFHKEGVLKEKINVRDKVLKPSDFSGG